MNKNPDEKENASRNRSEEKTIGDSGKGTDNIHVEKSIPDNVKLDIHNINQGQKIGKPDITFDQTTTGNLNETINFSSEIRGKVIPNPDRLTHSTINDAPTSHDTIGVTPIVKALARILIHPETQTPLTAGIYGPWGSGKTSFMRQVKNEIIRISTEDKKFLQVDFNAWKYTNKEELWMALLCLIASTFEQNSGFIKKYFYRLKLILKKINVASIICNLILLGVILLLILMIPLPIDTNVEASKWYSFINFFSFLPKSILSLISFLVISKSARVNLKKFMLPIGIDFSELVSSKNKNSINNFDDFQSKFTTAIDLYIPKKGRLIVYIDDLDRCSPTNTIKVIEAISLFLDLNKCIFVLGTDYDLFSKSIEVYYEDLYQKINQGKDDRKNGLLIETENESIFIDYEKPYGQYFLDKIIQIPIFIPKLNQRERENYLNSLLGSALTDSFDSDPKEKSNSLSKNEIIPDKKLSLEKEMIDSLINVTSIINPNPRNLKRFLTKFRFVYFLYYLNYRIFPRIEDDLLPIWFLYHELCTDEISALGKNHTTLPWDDFLSGFSGTYEKISAISSEFKKREKTKNLLPLQASNLTIEPYLELTRCLRTQ